MGFIDGHLLTLITFLPLMGAVVVLCMPNEKEDAIRYVSLAFAGVTLVLATYLTFFAFDGSVVAIAPGAINPENMQFVERGSWISAFNIEYYIGVDGLSITMVFLSALVSFFALIASFGIKKAIKAYFALFLILETGMTGVFVSLDFFLFYVFWEVMLLPMYFLIGVWGGPRKEYAAIKFFLYTLAGSVLMLLAMLALYFANDHSFDLLKMMANAESYNRSVEIMGHVFNFGRVLFIGLFIGFAIKVPVFPFHTWLPDAHVEAPTPISVILAGVLLKMGTYGIMRINFPIFPDAANWFAGFLAILGVINIVYGALCAMAQTDMKKLVAYSSVSHMGYCLLGIAALTPEGWTGALFQMFNHGTISAMLFLLVGVIYDRAHHRQIEGFGGLAQQMPIFAAFAGFAFFANLGLPGLSGFVSEVLCFMGAFGPYQTLTMIAVTGVVLTAAYCLWMVQRVFLGPKNPKYDTLPEINRREVLTLVPFAALTLLFGVYPAPILNLINGSMEAVVKLVGG
ncbi:MAG: NADH-quinone oxidoreductase subunit M [Chrysiogenetes bacterium]|nr:NADH-quinone oxidoreductase subunit M [Chrysiogenetes bacterium]